MHDCFFLIISHVLKFDTICVMILKLAIAIGTLCCNGVGFKCLARSFKLAITFQFSILLVNMLHVA